MDSDAEILRGLKLKNFLLLERTRELRVKFNNEEAMTPEEFEELRSNVQTLKGFEKVIDYFSQLNGERNDK